MNVTIKEQVTFIQPTREQAVTLAYEMGGGVVHALVLMNGLQPASKPVGYLVVPDKEKT